MRRLSAHSSSTLLVREEISFLDVNRVALIIISFNVEKWSHFFIYLICLVYAEFSSILTPGDRYAAGITLGQLLDVPSITVESVTFRNCSFLNNGHYTSSDNVALRHGNGIAVSVNVEASQVYFEDCKFLSNRMYYDYWALSGGGTVFISRVRKIISFVNCYFGDNILDSFSSFPRGGAIYIHDLGHGTTGSVQVVVSACAFVRNSVWEYSPDTDSNPERAEATGGAIHIEYSSPVSASDRLVFIGDTKFDSNYLLDYFDAKGASAISIFDAADSGGSLLTVSFERVNLSQNGLGGDSQRYVVGIYGAYFGGNQLAVKVDIDTVAAVRNDFVDSFFGIYDTELAATYGTGTIDIRCSTFYGNLNGGSLFYLPDSSAVLPLPFSLHNSILWNEELGAELRQLGTGIVTDTYGTLVRGSDCYNPSPCDQGAEYFSSAIPFFLCGCDSIGKNIVDPLLDEITGQPLAKSPALFVSYTGTCSADILLLERYDPLTLGAYAGTPSANCSLIGRDGALCSCILTFPMELPISTIQVLCGTNFTHLSVEILNSGSISAPLLDTRELFLAQLTVFSSSGIRIIAEESFLGSATMTLAAEEQITLQGIAFAGLVSPVVVEAKGNSIVEQTVRDVRFEGSSHGCLNMHCESPSYCKVLVQDSIFEDCTNVDNPVSTEVGAGLTFLPAALSAEDPYAKYHTIVIDSCHFARNYLEFVEEEEVPFRYLKRGGASIFVPYTDVTVLDTLFQLKNSTFSDSRVNTSQYAYGGAIMIGQGDGSETSSQYLFDTVLLESVDFKHCRVEGFFFASGGATYIESRSVRLTDVNFRECAAYGRLQVFGGGAFVVGGDILVENSAFRANVASAIVYNSLNQVGGSALYLLNFRDSPSICNLSKVSIGDNIVMGQMSTRYGAVMLLAKNLGQYIQAVYGTDLFFVNNTIENANVTEGVALSFLHSSASLASFDRITFTNNIGTLVSLKTSSLSVKRHGVREELLRVDDGLDSGSSSRRTRLVSYLKFVNMYASGNEGQFNTYSIADSDLRLVSTSIYCSTLSSNLNPRSDFGYFSVLNQTSSHIGNTIFSNPAFPSEFDFEPLSLSDGYNFIRGASCNSATECPYASEISNWECSCTDVEGNHDPLISPTGELYINSPLVDAGSCSVCSEDINMNDRTSTSCVPGAFTTFGDFYPTPAPVPSPSPTPYPSPSPVPYPSPTPSPLPSPSPSPNPSPSPSPSPLPSPTPSPLPSPSPSPIAPCPEGTGSDPSDWDSDGIPDCCVALNIGDAQLSAVSCFDNCMFCTNEDQSNLDMDELGDACDPDNCVYHSNCTFTAQDLDGLCNAENSVTCLKQESFLQMSLTANGIILSSASREAGIRNDLPVVLNMKVTRECAALAGERIVTWWYAVVDYGTALENVEESMFKSLNCTQASVGENCSPGRIEIPAHTIPSGSTVMVKGVGKYSSQTTTVTPVVVYGVLDFEWSTPIVRIMNGESAQVYRNILIRSIGSDGNDCAGRFGGSAPVAGHNPYSWSCVIEQGVCGGCDSMVSSGGNVTLGFNDLGTECTLRVTVEYNPCPQLASGIVSTASVTVQKSGSPVIPVSYIDRTTQLCNSLLAVSEVLALEVFVDEETAQQEVTEIITYTTVWESVPHLDLACTNQTCAVQSGGNGESTIKLFSNTLKPGVSYLFNVSVIPLGSTALTFDRSFSSLCAITAVGNPIGGKCEWVSVQEEGEARNESCAMEALEEGQFECTEWVDPSSTGLYYEHQYIDAVSGEWVSFGSPSSNSTSPYVVHVPYYSTMYYRTLVWNGLQGSTASNVEEFSVCLPSVDVMAARVQRSQLILTGCTAEQNTDCQTRELLALSTIPTKKSTERTLRAEDMEVACQSDQDFVNNLANVVDIIISQLLTVNEDPSTLSTSTVNSLFGVLSSLSGSACFATEQLWNQVLQLCAARGYGADLAGFVLNQLQTLTIAEDNALSTRLGVIEMSEATLQSDEMSYSWEEIVEIRGGIMKLPEGDMQRREGGGWSREGLEGQEELGIQGKHIERLEKVNKQIIAALTRKSERCGLLGANVNPNGAAYTLFSKAISGVELNNKGAIIPQAPGEDNTTVFYLSPGFGEFLLHSYNAQFDTDAKLNEISCIWVNRNTYVGTCDETGLVSNVESLTLTVLVRGEPFELEINDLPDNLSILMQFYLPEVVVQSRNRFALTNQPVGTEYDCLTRLEGDGCSFASNGCKLVNSTENDLGVLVTCSCSHLSSFGALFGGNGSNEEWTVYRIVSVSLLLSTWILLVTFFLLLVYFPGFAAATGLESAGSKAERDLRKN